VTNVCVCKGNCYLYLWLILLFFSLLQSVSVLADPAGKNGNTNNLRGGISSRIDSMKIAGDLSVNMVDTPFDARDYPIVEFDYCVPQGVNISFLVRVAGRWFEIGFTNDKGAQQALDINYARIGGIEGVVADTRWRAARFNLYDMLRTRTRYTLVEKIVMLDRSVPGLTRQQIDTSRQGACNHIHNFSITRDPHTGIRVARDYLLIDDFDQETDLNRLQGITSRYSDGQYGRLEIDFIRESIFGKGEVLRLSYDVTRPNSFAGYITEMQGLDLRDFQILELAVKGRQGMSETTLIFKDVNGNASKVALRYYLQDKVGEDEWHNVRIPLVAFKGDADWSNIELLSLSFARDTATAGSLMVDKIALDKRIGSLLVDDFNRPDNVNRLGSVQKIFVEGTAAVNGTRIIESQNVIYSLSFGGSIGDPVPGGEGLSHGGWQTGLAGIDCSDCGGLTLRIRGSRGAEQPNIYLDDGNSRWGVDIENYTRITTSWQEVTIPLRVFVDNGVDLTHLSELLVLFETNGMSGTIYLDDIRFGESTQH